jgi:hypothetical protein
MAPALLVVALIITAVAYRPVLFDFFAGDDFVHLIWLQQAVQHPDLIWKNFHTSWLDGTTTKFYRPLISVFMVSDYVLYNRSGFGFHLTNLLFHLTSTLFIFLICRHLGQKLVQEENTSQPGMPLSPLATTLFWPFFAATLFGLYPLHTEAVSWITGRVDAIVTAFTSGAFFFFLKYRQRQSRFYLCLCLLFMTLGLTSKEMAITLPPTFLLYELIFPRSSMLKKLDIASLPKRLRLAVLASLPFWILLAAYFGVRFYSLGTFFGGYDNTPFQISDTQAFFRTWQNGLRLFAEPINHELVSARALVTKLWDGYLVLAALGAILAVSINKSALRLFVFLTGWLVLCLIPVYKVFNIADDLQGSRLACLATVPLCMLLTFFVIATTSAAKKLAERHVVGPSILIRNLLAMGFVAVAFVILNLNNEAWVYTGNESNAIRAALSKLYDQVEGDPQVLFVGLPDQVHGAYLCRNALPGMTHTPQLQRDIVNDISVDRFEPIFPFALLKQSMYDNRSKINIFRWDTSDKTFHKVDLDAVEHYPQTLTQSFTGSDLTSVLTPSNPDNCTFNWRTDGSLEVQGNDKKLGRPEVRFEPGLTPCFALEFVRVSMRSLDNNDKTINTPAVRKANDYATREGADLLYTNDLVEKFELKCRTHTAINEPEANGQTELIFPLRSLPEWSLGGKCHELMLRLPHMSHYAIDKVEIVPASELIPQISFANCGYLGSKGFLHLSKGEPKQTIEYDANGIEHATGVMVETTRTNLLFEEQNGDTLSKVARSLDIKEGASGTIVLDHKDFTAPGIYQLRLFAKDKDEQRIGQASDHIVIAVDD